MVVGAGTLTVRTYRRDDHVVVSIGDTGPGVPEELRKRVVIVEDVTTTGGSSMKAVERAREEGLEVLGIITLVDRQEGAAENVTALAGVPTMWAHLSESEWPPAVAAGLRYITNSGGTLAPAVLRKLRTRLPQTQVFCMYGLTEAFRSTYLPPDELDRRDGSMGKAIPNTEVYVIGEDGRLSWATAFIDSFGTRQR